MSAHSTPGLRRTLRRARRRAAPLLVALTGAVADDALTVRRPAERRPLELVLGPVRRPAAGAGRG